MSRFSRLAQLAAAADSGDTNQLLQAGRHVVEQDGGDVFRAVLQQLHLFRGFPVAIRALNQGAELLSPEATESQPDVNLEGGQRIFQKLYGKDTGTVLKRMQSLDPLLGQWVLDHAYGRVIANPVLTLEERERLALLWLAGDGCWDQWESHRRNALRLGISLATLIADTHRFGWPQASAEEALRRLREKFEN